VALRNQGIRGIRFNLYGDNNPLETLLANEGLINKLPNANLHLQIHHDDGLLNQLLLAIPKGVCVVVDHFGRPCSDDEFIKNSKGIDKHIGNLWVKLSAQYRTPNINHRSIFQYWHSKIGEDRLIWGSDWPHTQFEESQNYALQMKNLEELSSNSELIKKILSANPHSLYWN
jgi:predicted TIM-barrel fold metal-dependent hydrolase